MTGRLRKVFGFFWPRGLTGQMVLLVVLAVTLAQVGAYVFFLDERREAVHRVGREVTLERIDSLVRLLMETPPGLHDKVVKAASSENTLIRLDDTSAVTRDEMHSRFSQVLKQQLSVYGVGEVRLGVSFAPPPDRHWRGRWRDRWRDDDDHDDDEYRDEDDFDHDDMMRRHHPDARPPWWDWHRGPRVFAIAVQLRDGTWLNVKRRLDPQPFLWALTGLIALGLTMLAVALVVAILVRRITGPVKALAAGADALGRGETVQPLAVGGAREVQQAVIAFNRMNDRLQRFVRDRLVILGALSHDLRTPLTTLRLRAEFVSDEELRDKILETLQEMEEMTEATLAFVREEAKQEDSRPVDLSALLESLCDDLRELEWPVGCLDGERAVLTCRPVALRRAFRNLIENAVKYGERCVVSWEESGGALSVHLDDNGPGIPPDKMEELFKPFVRLETSRSRETGGVGMGLAIARMIIRGHGGDITLENRVEGGLRVTVSLPQDSIASQAR